MDASGGLDQLLKESPASPTENADTLSSGSPKISPTNANGRQKPASIGRRADLRRSTARRDLAFCLTGTHIRLINASCEAFFIRRGLDPRGDWHGRSFGYR